MTHNDLETRIHYMSDQTLLSYIQQILPSQAVAMLERKSTRIHKGTFGNPLSIACSSGSTSRSWATPMLVAVSDEGTRRLSRM